MNTKEIKIQVKEKIATADDSGTLSATEVT